MDRLRVVADFPIVKDEDTITTPHGNYGYSAIANTIKEALNAVVKKWGYENVDFEVWWVRDV